MKTRQRLLAVLVIAANLLCAAFWPNFATSHVVDVKTGKPPNFQALTTPQPAPRPTPTGTPDTKIPTWVKEAFSAAFSAFTRTYGVEGKVKNYTYGDPDGEMGYLVGSIVASWFGIAPDPGTPYGKAWADWDAKRRAAVPPSPSQPPSKNLPAGGERHMDHDLGRADIRMDKPRLDKPRPEKLDNPRPDIRIKRLD